MNHYQRTDPLDPLPVDCEWPSLRSVTGRVDVHSLAAFFVRESRIGGAYFEFGVASGRSALAAIRANRRENPFGVLPFLLFDSFEGLPDMAGLDWDSKQFKPGEYASCGWHGRAFIVDSGVAPAESEPVGDMAEYDCHLVDTIREAMS